MWILFVCLGLFLRFWDDEFCVVVEDFRRIVERKMKDMEGKLFLFGFSGIISLFGFFMCKEMLLLFIDNYYGDFFVGNYFCKY